MSLPTGAQFKELLMQERDERIALAAYEIWQRRGCPEGSPEEDWFEAERRTPPDIGDNNSPTGSTNIG